MVEIANMVSMINITRLTIKVMPRWRRAGPVAHSSTVDAGEGKTEAQGWFIESSRNGGEPASGFTPPRHVDDAQLGRIHVALVEIGW